MATREDRIRSPSDHRRPLTNAEDLPTPEEEPPPLGPDSDHDANPYAPIPEKNDKNNQA